MCSQRHSKWFQAPFPENLLKTKASPENRSTVRSPFNSCEIRKGEVFIDPKYWLKDSLIHFGDLDTKGRIKLNLIAMWYQRKCTNVGSRAKKGETLLMKLSAPGLSETPYYISRSQIPECLGFLIGWNEKTVELNCHLIYLKSLLSFLGFMFNIKN